MFIEAPANLLFLSAVQKHLADLKAISLAVNTLLEQSLIIHNRCFAGTKSHPVYEPLGFIKPNLDRTPGCEIDRDIAVTL